MSPTNHTGIENQLMAALPEDVSARLAPHIEKVALKRAQFIITPGEPIKEVFFPQGALISITSLMQDGTTTEVGVVGYEGAAGISALLCSDLIPMQSLVQIPGSALRIKADVLKEEFDRCGPLQKLLLRYVQALIVEISQTAACNRRHPLEGRLARWLLVCSDSINSEELMLTQEYISTMLGVRRPGVSEAASELQKSGLIRYARGRIEILDRAGLEEHTCECYNIVRDEFARLLTSCRPAA